MEKQHGGAVAERVQQEQPGGDLPCDRVGDNRDEQKQVNDGAAVTREACEKDSCRETDQDDDAMLSPERGYGQGEEEHVGDVLRDLESYHAAGVLGCQARHG